MQDIFDKVGHILSFRPQQWQQDFEPVTGENVWGQQKPSCGQVSKLEHVPPCCQARCLDTCGKLKQVWFRQLLRVKQCIEPWGFEKEKGGTRYPSGQGAPAV